jgi:signal transduction histidine kinase
VHYGGSVEVHVARVVEQKGGEWAEVIVSDHGPGIPADRFEDVLQPFVRLDAARSRDTPGMGLGLAIVRRSIRAEGGTLTLANRAGGTGPDGAEPGAPGGAASGLIVTVRLPLGPGQRPAASRK